MLTVVENGVKVKLELCPQPKGFLTLMLITTLLLATVGVGLALGWLSVRLSIGAIAVIAIFSWLWRYYQQRYDVPIITGGEILVSNHQITHQPTFGNKQRYLLQTDDSIELSKEGITIINNKGKIRYHILGFNHERQPAIVQAVLQGKAIHVQGKTIQMQNNS